MLVLTRRVGEELVIGNEIRVTVIEVHGERVRLGVTAPASVRVDRQEVHARRSWQSTRLEANSAALADLNGALPRDGRTAS